LSRLGGEADAGQRAGGARGFRSGSDGRARHGRRVAATGRPLVHPRRMRDAQRLRQRLDLSLDGRQLVALTICALLLVTAVFSLGMLIGRRTAAGDVGIEISGDLAALDARARKEPPAILRAPKAPEATVASAPP